MTIKKGTSKNYDLKNIFTDQQKFYIILLTYFILSVNIFRHYLANNIYNIYLQ